MLELLDGAKNCNAAELTKLTRIKKRNSNWLESAAEELDASDEIRIPVNGTDSIKVPWQTLERAIMCFLFLLSTITPANGPISAKGRNRAIDITAIAAGLPVREYTNQIIAILENCDPRLETN
jgi:hypothetical protein